MSKPEIETFPSPEALAAAVAGRLVVRLAAVQAAGRTPSVCLTGGTIAEKIHEAVVAATEGHEDVDWSNVDFWWGDERYVPADDEGRNAKQAREVMLDHLDVDERRVHEMPASDGPHDSVEDAAEAYGDEVRRLGSGQFDVLMLGVGPDGHVASLFPGYPQLDGQGRRRREGTRRRHRSARHPRGRGHRPGQHRLVRRRGRRFPALTLGRVPDSQGPLLNQHTPGVATLGV